MLKRWTESLNTLIQTRKHQRFSALKTYDQPVQAIIEDVYLNQDEALRRLTKQFDGVDVESFKVPETALKKAFDECPEALKKALIKAKENITSYHQLQKYPTIQDGNTQLLRAQIVTPIESVGIYIPGGTARYPSSVLMNAIPAQVAGVKNIIMVTPPQKEGIDSSVLAAAYLCGVKEVYQVGGAQAIAALAYGTQSIPAVDKVVGPGNIYVALAKQKLSSVIGIDHFAGPSEVLILAGENANPKWVAADLIAQAEHDPLAQSILVTLSDALIEQVNQELVRQITKRTRKAIIEISLKERGLAIKVASLEEAYAYVNAIAPEHLEIILDDPLYHLNYIHHAGAIFLGPYTPEAIGDYMGGPNHTLPTSGTAKFASGLSTYDFLKRTSVLQYSKEAFNDVARDVITLAQQEQLDGHAYSVQVRKES
jgi:histidinol dehydrogenase